MNDLILNIIDRYLEMVYDFEMDYEPMLAISDPYMNHQKRNSIPEVSA